MRVVSGIYKRRRFEVPHTFKARPTTDFAKESLFDVLSNRFDFEEEDLTALDLFSGTGSIGLEFLSRGCSRVVSVEKDRAHHAFICKVMREIGSTDRWIPIRGDVFKYLTGTKKDSFDIIFADPPYDLPELDSIPERIFASGLLKEGGLFILEHGKKHHFEHRPRFTECRQYGAVHFSFFTL